MHRVACLVLSALGAAACAPVDGPVAPVAAAPVVPQRVVGVRVMMVEVPPQSPLTSTEGIISRDMPGAPPDEFVPFIAADRVPLLEGVMRADGARTHAQARIVVEQERQARLEMGRTEACADEITFDVRVVRSQPGSVEAWVGYREGDRYELPPTWIHLDDGQAIVIRVHAQDPAARDRQLVITIDRPGDESPLGC